MSLKTKLLELFKYDPSTDGAQTFNIKQALNDNWDKLDTWAQGVKTSLTAASTHEGDKNNPHGVTPAQIGAVPLATGSGEFYLGVEDGKLYIMAKESKSGR